MDGSAIWLTSIANMLTLDEKVDLTILLKASIRRSHVVSNIEKIEDINIVDPFRLFSNKNFEDDTRLTVKDASEIIQMLDRKDDYNLIITRGKLITEASLEKTYRNKQIPYITDFNHNETELEVEELSFFKKVYTTFPNTFVQTTEMKEFLMNILDVEGEKFILLPPTVKDIEWDPEIGLKNYSVVYTGKFAKQWKTEEMIETQKKINDINNVITLNVAGDKFQGELIEKKEEILLQLKSTKGINWVGSVSREESIDLIKSSDLGFAYRSEEIDNDYSLELSTKFLEYGINGKPIVLRRTKQYENLLGSDYPLFANSEAELLDKILLAFNDNCIYNFAALKCYNASKKYQLSIVSKQVLKQLWLYNNKKKTVLFAGHDFKFLNWYIEACKNNDEINVLIDYWSNHETHNIDESEKLLQEADIIFCEWGLGNAVWYSHNKLKGQQLFIRLHRQEIDTLHLESVNYDNVSKVVVIAPHLFEEFNRVKKVPRDKMVIIENMIDYERFNKPKFDDIQYNLGIIGVLPKLKRLDRALDILEQLWRKNNKYKLFIKGKLPQDLPWLMGRKEERVYYENVFSRIEEAEWKDNVIFDQHGNDVDEWLRKINFVLSTSDIEGSHVAPMEGMASGALPIVYHWPGAETVYPMEFVVESVEEAVQKIEDPTIYKRLNVKEYPKKFNLESRVELFNQLLLKSDKL